MAQGVGEFSGNNLADEGVGEWIGDGGGKLVEAEALGGGEAVAEAGKGEGGLTDPRRSREIDHLCSDRVDHTEIRPCHAAGHGESCQHPRRRRVSPFA